MSDSIEAEIVPTQALTVRPQGALSLPTIADLEQSFALAKRQRELIKDYIQSQLKPAKHFYSVRSASKPSLTKEGAEVILLAHGLIPDYDIVSGPMEPTEGSKSYQIVIKCVLRPRGNSEGFAGSGIGSASSFVTKKDGGRIARQNDPGLCHNATMKMAQKSAMIAAVLNSTAASEFFTQDIEEAQTEEQPADFKPKPKPSIKPKKATSFDDWLEACRTKLLDLCKPVLPHAWIYAVKQGWILPNEQLTAVTARKMFPHLSYFQRQGEPDELLINANKEYVAKRKEEIMAAIQAIADGPRDEDMMQQFSAAYVVDEPEPEPDVHVPRDIDPEPSEEDWWREVEFHFGKSQGTALGDMEKNKLYGWWANWEPKEYKGEISPQDKRLREALDAAGEHYHFKS